MSCPSIRLRCNLYGLDADSQRFSVQMDIGAFNRVVGVGWTTVVLTGEGFNSRRTDHLGRMQRANPTFARFQR